MKRAIGETFFNDLLQGQLSKVLNMVHNDTTLLMELRGNEVIIYYRGGVLFSIREFENEYKVTYNSDYWSINKKYSEISEIPSIDDCVRYVALYKDQMDFHMANAKKTLEKQCQQRFVLENNVLGKVIPGDKESKNATTGDYFILDTEYAYKKKGVIDARFDAVALKWPSLSTSRKKRNGLGLSFVEIKYYDDAMDGKSGIKKHIGDYLNFKNMPAYHEMCRDMEDVFYQKCKLGLVPAYTTRLKMEDSYYKIKIDDTNVDFVFVFANRDPDSTRAREEIKKAIDEYGEDLLNDIYVANSSEMGYILFRYADKGNIDRYIPISKF